MESCEQQARNILEAMSSANEWTDPQRLTSGDVVELANLIAENRRLRAIQDAAWNYVHAVELDRSPGVALLQFLKVLYTAADAAGEKS